MIAVIQRVIESSVTVNNQIVGTINKGLTVLLGVETGDQSSDVVYLADKIISLRIFGDSAGKMNLSLSDIQGEMLVISQFTLAGNCSKGRRPSFDKSASPEIAKALYEAFISRLKSFGIKVETGIFAADMLVDIKNDGPVTFVLNSKK